MKKKIIGIFVCMLLIATILPVTGIHDEKTISSTSRIIELIPVIDFQEIGGDLFSISVLLTNSGEGTANNIYWEMNAIGALFFSPQSINGTIDTLYPSQNETIEISPVFGLGIPIITFYCKYEIVNFSVDVDFEVKQEWRDLALLFWHIFPEWLQPTKDWVDVNYSYFKTDTSGVEFNYKGINNMHNVRVVLGLPSCSQGAEFLAACKFTNGTGILYEGGITEDLVTGGDAHWELELVDGE